MELQIILYILGGWVLLFLSPSLGDLRQLFCPIKKILHRAINPQAKITYKCFYRD
jgi:hypothetical protein